MAPTTDPSSSAERIEDIDVASEMQQSFLEYAYSVIYARALPDARDGLKPVQRRILFQMNDMGLRPDRGHVKSARVVGEVMGKLHPHGDASIYDALVRLAQDFNLRLPLVDGHGNFGSLDDGPAASRYTEARLTPASLAMTADLDEDVVDFVPNYDNQIMQPEVLPSAYPNLLVNGASGIAVGMATNMAPHNLIEVVNAARHLLSNPNATLDELMAFVPGPDLPTGGIIMGLDGIREAYVTGRGSFRTRARATVENVSARKVGIVVTELPYMVGPEKVIDKIKDGVNSKKISGISNVVDLTDRHHGLKLVIEIKTGFDADAVLETLFRLTPLEDTFSINNVALVDGGPQTLGLRELLEVYVAHRKDVVYRRSSFRLAKRRDRLHLVEGLLVAIADIDAVIGIIRASDDVETAKAVLQKTFDLSDSQTEYILELRLRRLTKFSRLELEREADELKSEIAELQEVIDDPQKLIDVVSRELEAIARALGTPRRTVLSTSTVDVAAARAAAKSPVALEMADSPCRVALSSTQRLVRIDLDSKDSIPVPSPHRSSHDAIVSTVAGSRRQALGGITSHGRLVHISPEALPGVPASAVALSGGVRAEDYLDLTQGERVRFLVPLTGEGTIAIGTREGIVKRLSIDGLPPKSGSQVISLREGDQVIGGGIVNGNEDLVFVSSDAQLLRFPSSTVRPQGSSANGMLGMKISPDALGVFFGVAQEQDNVVTVSASLSTLVGTDAGRVKVSPLSAFPSKGRGTGGVRAQTLLKGEDAVALAWVGPGSPRANGLDGTPRDLPKVNPKRDGSGEKVSSEISYLGSDDVTQS
ncbi:MAG: DNA gyrase/topoisomerase IV subunit A [Microbacteriaceae bacterium]